VPGGFAERFAVAYAAEIDDFLAEVAGEADGSAAAGWRDDAAAVALAMAAQRDALGRSPQVTLPAPDCLDDTTLTAGR
jgi:hypothetical protein